MRPKRRERRRGAALLLVVFFMAVTAPIVFTILAASASQTADGYSKTVSIMLTGV